MNQPSIGIEVFKHAPNKLYQPINVEGETFYLDQVVFALVTNPTEAYLAWELLARAKTINPT
jgi:hypothetical protein